MSRGGEGDISPAETRPAQAPAQKFSLSLGGPHKASNFQRKRPHAVLEEDNRDAVEDHRHEISVFGKASKPIAEPARILQCVQDTDWKDRRKRQKSGIPADSRPQQSSTDDTPVVQEGLKQGGLTLVKPTIVDHTDDVELPQTNGQSSHKPKTIDEEAMDALTGRSRPAARTIAAASEEEAFQDSFETAPAAPSLADFTATPVEGFGTALLRGYLKQGRTLEDYGYDENATSSEVKKRPAGLGLGAKQSGIPEIEIGAWGKAAKRKGGEGYIPLSMKNKKTGEVLTQDQLKEKLESQKYVGATESSHSRRDRSRDSDRKGIESKSGGDSRSKHDRDDYSRRRERESRRDYDRRDHDRRDHHYSRHDRDGRDDRRRDERIDSKSDRRRREDETRSKDRSRSRDRRKDHHRSSRR